MPSEEKEYNNVFTIPPNYTDSGKLMGGMLETRNTVEAAALILLVGGPELLWMPLPVTVKVVVMTVTLLPLGVFALMGIGGDSLLQYASHMVLYWIRRRQLHYRRIGYQYDPDTLKQRPKKAAGRPQKATASGVRPGVHSAQGDQKRHHKNN